MKLTYYILLDQNSSFARQYSVVGIPTTYVLSRENVIRYRILGEIKQGRVGENRKDAPVG